MVDAAIAQAYVGIITSVPHGTPSVADTANGERIRPTPTRHGIERTLKHRRLMHDDQEWFVGASIELRTSVSLWRIILRITRCAENAFISGVILPWVD